MGSWDGFRGGVFGRGLVLQDKPPAVRGREGERALEAHQSVSVVTLVSILGTVRDGLFGGWKGGGAWGEG